MNNDNMRRPSSAAPRRQFLDVMHPGRTPASPTSRPVLASNRPQVQDSSMKPSAPAVPQGLINQQKNTPSVVAPPQQPSAPPPAAPAQAPRPMAQPRPQPRIDTMQRQASMPTVYGGSVQQLEPPPAPEQHPEPHPHHYGKRSVISEILAILAIILLIAVILNILADADIINLPIPHTNFFDY